MLGFATRDQLEGFLKQRRVDESFSIDEIEQQVEKLKQLGFQMQVVVALPRPLFAATPHT